MDDAIRDILDALRECGELNAAGLDRIIRAHSKRAGDGRRIFAKKRVLPRYLEVRAERGALWDSWHVDDDLDARFVKALQMKPRRSASGVATITVITKPWPCANDCVYCPNDESMPKSYLSDEPACQRAERHAFHPYLQIASRLRTLSQMGHATDKVEVIVLGGTWLDYPPSYRRWYVFELFRALDDTDDQRNNALAAAYADGIMPSDESDVTLAALRDLQAVNETADHRMVGLVVETRPDTVTCGALREMRELGCTKLQMGVQSVDEEILRANGRRETLGDIRRAFELTRLFGFKTHAHFMVNLLGATPESDKRDYATFVSDNSFLPDEVKLYPCALVAGTQLVDCYERGTWRPYTEAELLDVLGTCMTMTPPYTRVSRMIRDISSKDILVGNKKTNLRQLVDEKLRAEAVEVREIRFREIGTGEVSIESLEIDVERYETSATREAFLQWVDGDGRIAGFLRLSLPKAEAFDRYGDLPVAPDEAMIREVHVYGFATPIDAEGRSAQHRGLGRELVERACAIAADEGYRAVNVISAVGTRAYYRKLGFRDAGLYQRKSLL